MSTWEYYKFDLVEVPLSSSDVDVLKLGKEGWRLLPTSSVSSRRQPIPKPARRTKIVAAAIEQVPRCPTRSASLRQFRQLPSSVQSCTWRFPTVDDVFRLAGAPYLTKERATLTRVLATP